MKALPRGAAASLAGLMAALLLLACASPPEVASMQAAPAVRAATPAAGAVDVVVTGGTVTSDLTGTSLADAELAAAIRNSLTAAGLFSQVGGGPQARWQLSVWIVNLSRPMFGGSLTVDLETSWTLLDRSTQQVLLRKAVQSQHTATMAESLAGVTRLRLAVEGAARKNVEAGLRELAALQLR